MRTLNQNMDYNFAIAGLFPELSHFYLQKTNSRAVCGGCSSLFIPGSNVIVEFIDHIPKGKHLFYRLNKNEKSADFVLYTCRICQSMTIFSGRKVVMKSTTAKSKKKMKSLLKDVLKKPEKEVGIELSDFLKSV
jgi:RNase P subunit RPR2